MKNKKKKSDTHCAYTSGFVVQEYSINDVEVKLIALIESMGLKDSQEQSSKILLKDILWEVLKDSLWITGEEHTALRMRRDRKQF